MIDMKLYDKTTYRTTYNDEKDKMPKFMKDHEDKMKKECVRKMQEGSLHRFVETPF